MTDDLNDVTLRISRTAEVLDGIASQDSTIVATLTRIDDRLRQSLRILEQLGCGNHPDLELARRYLRHNS